MIGRKPKVGAIKWDTGKADLSLLPRAPLEEIAKVLSFGAEKYGRYNWRKGFTWSRVIAAAQRHLNAFNDGESKDHETNLSHAAHAACNLLFLLQYEKDHPELDDRYYDSKPGKAKRRSRTVKRTAKNPASAGKKLKKRTSKV